MKRLIIAVGLMATAFFATLGLGAAEASGPSADSVRVVSQLCAPDGSVTVTVAWNSGLQGSQRLDVSAFSNAFQAGTFMSYGDLSPLQSSYVVAGLRPGMPYYVRVNTFSVVGWVSSPTAVVYANGCASYYLNWVASPYVQPIVPVNAVYNTAIGTWINGSFYNQMVSAVNTPYGVRYVYTPVVR